MSNIGLVTGSIQEDATLALYNIELITSLPIKDKTKSKAIIDMERIQIMVNYLDSYLKTADIIVVELPVGSQSSRASVSYGFCLTAIASIKNTKKIYVTPNQVKKVVSHATDVKKPTKLDMINWAYSKYPELNWFTHKRKGKEALTLKNEHPADAIAAIHAAMPEITKYCSKR